MRQCFVSDKEYLIIDTYLNVDGNPTLLRVETEKEASSIQIPDFLNIFREVTDEGQYETRILARDDYKMNLRDKEGTHIEIYEERKGAN